MERRRGMRRTNAGAGVRWKNVRNVRMQSVTKVAMIATRPNPTAKRAMMRTSAKKATAKLKTKTERVLSLRMPLIYVRALATAMAARKPRAGSLTEANAGSYTQGR